MKAGKQVLSNKTNVVKKFDKDKVPEKKEDFLNKNIPNYEKIAGQSRSEQERLLNHRIDG